MNKYVMIFLAVYFSVVIPATAQSSFIVDPDGDLIFYKKSGGTLFSELDWEALSHSPYYTHASNAVRNAQIPNKLNYFVAREVQEVNTENEHWHLVLVELNESTGHFSKIKDLLTRGEEIGDNYVVMSAYDPTVMVYEGEVWVGFECTTAYNGQGRRQTVDNQNIGTNHVSTCIGLLDTDKWAFDRSRISIPVVSQEEDILTIEYRYSASVPKLLVYNNIPYLYYTVVRSSEQYKTGDNKHGFIDLNTRGVRLYKERNGRERLWARGATTGVGALSPLSTIVFDKDEDKDNINVADVFDVKVGNDNTIMAITGVGKGAGCINGISQAGDCYYPVFSETRDPLSYNNFKNSITNDTLRNQVASYPTFFKDSQDKTSLLVMFTHPESTPFGRAAKIFHNINNNLVLEYDTNVNPIPVYENEPGVLGREGVLESGEFIDSPNGQYRLIMQNDGNLVLYRLNGQGQPQSVVWSPYTQDYPHSKFVFQYDSNLVVYSATGVVLWVANTDTYGGVRFKVQNDGNLVLYDRFNSSLWTTNTMQ